jgi:DNA mismatch endonuclease, patch repair protein
VNVTQPTFKGLRSASDTATKAARASSAKTGTGPELLLRRSLTRLGLRYRIDVSRLQGRPDIVFQGRRVAVFVDGDFWHGRDFAARVSKLRSGHNGAYWVSKITRNVERDTRNTVALQEQGWVVVRVWETDVKRDADEQAAKIAAVLRARPTLARRRR